MPLSAAASIERYPSSMMMGRMKVLRSGACSRTPLTNITALTLSGEVVDWLDTALEPGALMGIELDAAGRIYVVDAVRDRILRLSPR
jgi:sugar lactone lactonase YvrE